MHSLTLWIITDFHHSIEAKTKLLKLLSTVVNPEYHLVLSLGDTINNRDEQLPYLKELYQSIVELGFKLGAIHGNNEPTSAYAITRELGVNLHLEQFEWQGYSFTGIGGFGLLNEPVFADLNLGRLAIDQETIFLTHIPPNLPLPVTGPYLHLHGHLHWAKPLRLYNQTYLLGCPAGIDLKITQIVLPALDQIHPTSPLPAPTVHWLDL